MKRIFKIFVDLDKEERWLNEMAAHGLLLAKPGPFYSFTPIAPGSAVVRIDCRPSMSAADFEDYRSLFSDAGWQHLSGPRSGGNQYFASTAGDANADIFSESDAKTRRYRRALGVNAITFAPLLLVGFVLWTAGSADFATFVSPREWYLTPGIWEKQGMEFVGAFLFETPFVILRQAAPLLLVVASLVMLTLLAYQAMLYRRAKSKSNAV